jgi:hypothetical protein
MQDKYFVVQNHIDVRDFVQNPYNIPGGIYFQTRAQAEEHNALYSMSSTAPSKMFGEYTKYNIYAPSLSVIYEVNSNDSHPSSGLGIGVGPVSPLHTTGATFYVGADILHPAETLTNISVQEAQQYMHKRLLALDLLATRCEATPNAAFCNNVDQSRAARAYELSYSMKSLYNSDAQNMSMSDRVLAAITKDCANTLSVYTICGIPEMYDAYHDAYNKGSSELSELQRISNAVHSGLEKLADSVLITDYLAFQKIMENANNYLSTEFNRSRQTNHTHDYIQAMMACVPAQDYKAFSRDVSTMLAASADKADPYNPVLFAAKCMNNVARKYIQGSVINHDGAALATYQSMSSNLMSDIAHMESLPYRTQMYMNAMGLHQDYFNDAMVTCTTGLAVPGHLAEELSCIAAQRYVNLVETAGKADEIIAYAAVAGAAQAMLNPYQVSDILGPSVLNEIQSNAAQKIEELQYQDAHAQIPDDPEEDEELIN